MTYNNFSISGSKGKLYLKSPEPKEGYEKVTYGTDNKTTYHKYFNSTQGILKYFDVKEVEYQGKKLQFLEVTLINGDEYNKVSVPLKNSKSNYTDDVKSLVSSLNGAQVGQEVTLTPVKTKTTGKNGKEYENLNIFINYVNKLGENGKGLSTGFIPYDEIPKPEKEEDEDLGITWNWKPVNKFFALKIKEIKVKFEGVITETPKEPVKKELPTQSPNQAFAPATSIKEEAEIDSLPF